MKSITTLAAIVALFAGMVASSLLNENAARGQGGAASLPQEGSGRQYPGTVPAGGGGYSFPTTQRDHLGSTINALRAAKTKAETDKVRKVLDGLLKDRFDNDLKQREREIADIENRVKVLKGILEKRRAARDAIIQLQLKVLVNEAEGLGFPGRSSKSNSPFGIPRSRNSAPGTGFFGTTTRRAPIASGADDR